MCSDNVCPDYVCYLLCKRFAHKTISFEGKLIQRPFNELVVREYLKELFIYQSH